MDRCDDVGPAVALFRSLADPARLAIVPGSPQGEARVVDLTRLLGLAQSTVSKHLACLRDCRLVDFRIEGRQSYYSLARPELIDLLRSAELLLAETGEAVALCPVYGEPAAGPRGGVVTADHGSTAGRAAAADPAAGRRHDHLQRRSRRSWRSPPGRSPSSVALIGFGLDSVIEVSSAAADRLAVRRAPTRSAGSGRRCGSIAVLVLRAGRLRDRRGRPRHCSAPATSRNGPPSGSCWWR